ncbi:hypothetical protein PRCB_11710 [Pantoea rodasii]|uniref:Uncharacterized protein n=1 Tax=Pantoea rodasii TaxID=1076549 RepID=A0A2M9WCZ5_9GAMM|nr:hypothetical protein [Pantoea rodasii]ORM60111.1 hypothetical protein HA45_22090 [Pantoea rodasii]PJZ05348.1 hypothetical protein PRCB_11710 [Pantoea rodasii]
MADKELKLPFSYCKIERGASILGVNPTDLINLAVLNKIEVCMMLRHFYSRVFLRANFSEVKDWYGTLQLNSRWNYLAATAREISNQSVIEFTNAMYNQPEKLISGIDVFNEMEGSNHVTGVGFASGLWRIMPEQFEGTNYVERFFPSFSPCLTGGESPVAQLMPAQPFEDFKNGKKFDFQDHIFTASHDDLWVTSYDLKRIHRAELDFDALPDLGSVERLDIEKTNKPEINIRSEKALERHARNELIVISAAFKYREENSEEFNSECIKKDSSYNYSAWARNVMDRVALFPNQECPVRSADKVAHYISKVFK